MCQGRREIDCFRVRSQIIHDNLIYLIARGNFRRNFDDFALGESD